MSLPRKIIARMNARRYSVIHKVGKGCSFGRIKFWDCERKSISIGKRVIIFRKTEICAKNNAPVIIGDNTFINQQCIIRPNTTIGKNVSIAPCVTIITDTHKMGTKNKRAGEQQFLPIEIGDGCWIGAKSTILGGVKIGEGTVIGAGSLVNKDCESNSLYAGVPAKFIKKLD